MKLKKTELLFTLFGTTIFMLVSLTLLSQKWPADNRKQPPNPSPTIPVPTANVSSPKTASSSTVIKASPPPEKLTGFCLRNPILLYHHIQPTDLANSRGEGKISVDNEIFEKQIKYLAAAGYQTSSLDVVVEALVKHQPLPAKNIVLTFDDGYEDFYLYAFPILRNYGLTANLMIPTGLIGNSGYLSWPQIKEMSASGLVFFYDHTWSHANLSQLSNEKIQFEIMTAKKQLEENLSRPVNIFAYPYGSENTRVIELLRQDGFIAALSTNPGFSQCDSFIMSLHRNRIGNTSLTSYGL